jgi:DHA1 family multidrug/chloramphenicol efflux transport protein-like MFS transporter
MNDMKTKNLVIFPFILIFYEIITYLSNDLYLPALTDLMRDFNSTPAMAQLTLTMWFLGSASTQLIMGPLSDRYGRRPILLSGAVLFIFSTIICAATHSISILLIARFIQGSAVCSFMVAGYATVHELYDSKQAIHVLVLMGSIGILAPAFGPLLGGLILQMLSWRYLFWFLAVGAILAIILLYQGMPESNPKENRTPFELKNVFRSYCFIISNKQFMLTSLILCLIYGGLIAWLTMGPLLITEAYHYSPLMFGFFQALIFTSFIGGNVLIKHLMNVYSINRIIFIGLILTTAGSFLALLASLFYVSYIILFVLTLMIYAGGAALQYGTLQRLAVEASQEPMGLRMAIFSSFLGIAGVLSSAISSYIYNETSIKLAYFLFTVSVIAFILNFLRNKEISSVN